MNPMSAIPHTPLVARPLALDSSGAFPLAPSAPWRFFLVRLRVLRAPALFAACRQLKYRILEWFSKIISYMAGAILVFGKAEGEGNIPCGSCRARPRRQKPKAPWPEVGTPGWSSIRRPCLAQLASPHHHFWKVFSRITLTPRPAPRARRDTGDKKCQIVPKKDSRSPQLRNR